MRGLAVTALLLAAGCSSSPDDCPMVAPGSGEACSGTAACVYGPVSCTCVSEAWDCNLPFSPEISDGAGDDEGDDADDDGGEL